jgi:hypothetical protein
MQLQIESQCFLCLKPRIIPLHTLPLPSLPFQSLHLQFLTLVSNLVWLLPFATRPAFLKEYRQTDRKSRDGYSYGNNIWTVIYYRCRYILQHFFIFTSSRQCTKFLQEGLEVKSISILFTFFQIDWNESAFVNHFCSCKNCQHSILDAPPFTGLFIFEIRKKIIPSKTWFLFKSKMKRKFMLGKTVFTFESGMERKLF